MDHSIFFVLCALACAWFCKSVSGGEKENLIRGKKILSKGKKENHGVPTYVKFNDFLRDFLQFKFLRIGRNA
jgi:hypothetical protein